MKQSPDFRKCLKNGRLVKVEIDTRTVARALVHQKGYREKSHQCLAIALRDLYVRSGKLDEQMLMEFEDAKALREEADYRGAFTETAAKHSVKVAKQFVEIATKLTSESQ